MSPGLSNEAVRFADPSGLTFELVATKADNRTPWTGGGLGADVAIRGLHGVTMVVGNPTATVALMTELLGFEVVSETKGRIALAVNGNEPGKRIDLSHGTGAGPASNGIGTVHLRRRVVRRASRSGGCSPPLWRSTAGTLLVEGALFAWGIWIYLRVTTPRDRTGVIALWSLLIVSAGLWASSPWSAPPPSARALAWLALGAWLIVAWAGWADRHRMLRSHMLRDHMLRG